jgi:hypothetical protein
MCKICRLLMLRAPSAYSCSVFTCIASWKCTFKCSYVGTRTESYSFFFIVENDWIFGKYLHPSVKLTTLHHTFFMLSCKLMICSTAMLKSRFCLSYTAGIINVWFDLNTVIKVRTFGETHKIWKNLPRGFDRQYLRIFFFFVLWKKML